MLLPVLSVLGLLAAVCGLYAYLVEPRWLRIRRRVLHLDGWDPSLDGLTILHLSDLHIGRHNRRLRRFVQAAAAIDADVVAVTGDFVHRPAAAREVPFVLSPLAGRPMLLGVPGNHEYYDYSLRWPGGRGRPFDTSVVIETLRNAGVHMLFDETIEVRKGSGTATFAGVALTYGRSDRLKALMDGKDPRTVVLLAHSPDILPEAAAHDIALVLSGHTHGGQVRLGPWLTPTTATRIPLERPAGLIAKGRTLMHISPGLGTTLLPLRFFARPEITLLELRTTLDERGVDTRN